MSLEGYQPKFESYPVNESIMSEGRVLLKRAPLGHKRVPAMHVAINLLS